MDKQQARDIVRDTLGKSFAKEAFTRLVKELFNQIDESKAFHARGYVPESYKKYVKTYERIATYTDPNSLKIDILIVYLQSESTLERARTSQRNFIAHYLKERDQKDAGLVAFVSPDLSDWRFSLVKMDYRFAEGKDGKVKVKEEFTPARRWSFLVGTNENSHTAQSRLAPLIAEDTHNPALAELEEAFNIETVTKEFFTEYRNLFLRVKDSLDAIVAKDASIKNNFEQNGVNTVDFAKKLLGQIVFLYFLQKKGWFGVSRDAQWGTGSKKFLRELFEGNHGQYNNFFNDILEPLFYDALSRDRSDIDHWNDHFKCKIPFLNGGLFDPINGYDWVKTDIFIPNELFSNNSKTNKGDTGDGILDVFDRYNFTVKEDEPLEKEVAIDPELLGKAYEKFNAIRPDNYQEYLTALKSGKKGDESKFNKQFGVYYTPREIVHYMCQQNLINYLFSQFNGGIVTYERPGDRQTDLLGNTGKKGQLDITIEHKERSVIPKEDIETLIHYGERLSENEEMALIKQQKINEGQQKTSDYKLKLPDSIRYNAAEIDSKLAGIKVCDPAIGSGAFPVGMMSEIVRARNTLSTFIKNTDRSIYHFKRECIENSLYGVDIDAGAVEIAKLRLWLSLVVDEDDIRQIKPLPNLDYKIVCGNSLLGVEKNLFNSELFEKLEKVKPRYFNETNPTKKQEYKKQIDSLISQITNGHSEFDFEVYFSEVFHEKGGFDVVIGNPPYETSRSKSISSEIKAYLKNNYESAEDKFDYYVFFIEKSSRISKPDGLISLITPSSYLLKPLSKKIREYLILKCKIINIIEFKGMVFEAVVPTAIITFSHSVISESHKILAEFDINDLKSFQNGNYKTKLIEQDLFNNPPAYYLNVYADGVFFSLLEKLQTQENIIQLGKLAEIYNGIQTGDDKKYVSRTKSSNKWEKVIVGSDINRYFKSWGGKYVYYDPAQLHSNTREDVFKTNEKIIIRQTSDCIIGAYDDERYFTLASTFVIKQFEKKISYKALLGILNSKLFLYLYRNINNEVGRILPQIKKRHIYDFPIKLSGKGEDDIAKLVNHILSFTQYGDYLQNPTKQAKVKEYEKEIDQMVYALYGLTGNEIKIVEGEK